MDTISAICDAILEEHIRMGRDLDRFLLSGKTPSEIGAATSQFPKPLPRSVVMLYSWRNGTRQGTGTFNDIAFFPIWFFMPIDQAMDAYKVLTNGELPNELWSQDTFPLFTSGAGDFIGVNCVDDEKLGGEIVCYRHATGTVTEFVSLDAMLKTLLECFKAGAFFTTDDGRFEVDRAQLREIARQFNPGVGRWQKK